GDHHVLATLCGQQCNLAADAAASADDESNLAGELFLRWLAANLGLFERPVLNAEGFARRERDVVVVNGEVAGRNTFGGLRHFRASLAIAQRTSALHDPNSIGVELARNAGLGLVLAEGEHADAGEQ